MSGDETSWLTYGQAADKLGVSRQAVRQKAIRGRWPRTKGNDGQARVQVPEQPYRVPTVSGQAPDVSLLDSLRDHVASLKAENETLKAQFAGAEGRAVAESARAGEECTKTAQAIAAFETLAQRLEAIAEARRPWWRRLVG